MKKLALVLVVILLGIFLLNAMQMQLGAKIYPEQTMGYVFGICNENFQKMTSAEQSLLVSRCGAKDIENATILIELWGSLLRVATESSRIISER